MKTISAVNSFLRTLIALAVFALVGSLGWYGYTEYYADDLALKKKERELTELQGELTLAQTTLQEKETQLAEKDVEIDELNTEVALQELRIQQLDTAMQLLKVDHRLAEITVLDQGSDDETEETYSTIQFVEINDDGDPIDTPREFRVRGDIVYVDYWVVKFEDQYVEQADLDRSTSICLFRRIFGEFQEPKDGYVLDEVGERPTVYARGRQLTQFESHIWSDFWDIANDPEAAQAKGIRAAHGEAVSTQLRTGKKYRLLLRASGGLSIEPLDRESSPL